MAVWLKPEFFLNYAATKNYSIELKMAIAAQDLREDVRPEAMGDNRTFLYLVIAYCISDLDGDFINDFLAE